MATAAPPIPGNRACVESAQWSEPVVVDLTRTSTRVSVPKDKKAAVPKKAGVYAICRESSGRGVGDLILDIGECGPRPASGGGLRGRLASAVDHSAAQRIAEDLTNGKLQGMLFVVWAVAASKEEAEEAQDALLCLFEREFGRQPKYNRKPEYSHRPEAHGTLYDNLKILVGGRAGADRSGMGPAAQAQLRQRAIDRIAHKLRTLSAERVGEVEDLVDFLNHRDDERAATETALAASAPVLSDIWDNPDDAEYDSL